VARELRIAADTVRKWRRRFLAERLDGLADEPRPGRPPTISVDQVEAVVIATLERSRRPPSSGGARGRRRGPAVQHELDLLGTIDVLPDGDGSRVVYSQERLPESLAPIVERAVSEGIAGSVTFRPSSSSAQGRGVGERSGEVGQGAPGDLVGVVLGDAQHGQEHLGEVHRGLVAVQVGGRISSPPGTAGFRPGQSGRRPGRRGVKRPEARPASRSIDLETGEGSALVGVGHR
jgi:hypothetical protein